MNPNSLYKVNSEVIHETIEGEVIIVNLKTGTYYSLDNVGAVVWNYIESDYSAHEIVDELSRNYDRAVEEIRDAVTKLISQLKQENLIVENQNEAKKGISLGDNTPENKSGKNKGKFQIPKLGKYVDMQELLLLDPIHEVDEQGWPNPKDEDN